MSAHRADDIAMDTSSPLPRHTVPQPIALAPMQAGMLYQYLLSEGVAERGGYNIEQLHIRCAEGLDARVLGRAFTSVARRHAILSTAFRWEGVDEPQQVYFEAVTVPVHTIDWQKASETELPKLRASLLAEDRQRGFDLRKAPLLRLTVCQLPDGRSELLWTFHHILLDGRSFATVLLEVFATYDALQSGKPVSLAPPPRPYSDYIDWLAKQNKTESLAFFKSLLRGKTAPTPLPCAEPASRPLARHGARTVSRFLPSRVARELGDFAQQQKTSLAGLLQAAWAIVLSRLTADDDVVFGSVRSARRSGLQGEAEHMVGLFINSLPMRLAVDNQQLISDFVQSARTQSIALRAHDQIPLVDIQAASDLPRGTALFETLLMYENRELNRTLREHDASWSKRECELHEQPSPPLTIIIVDDERFELRVVCDRRRFRDGVAERIAGYLTTALESLVRATRVGEVDVLPAAERQRILFEWNDTEHAFSDEARIHELFEARVQEQPDAIALEMDGQSLTYRQLEARANQIAHALRARGALPGHYVGVCLSRGLPLVAALLGVAKSGAAYVPLDSDYPRDRISFMLEDAGAKLVLTEHDFVERFNLPVLLVDGPDIDQASATRPAPVGELSDPCYAIYTSGSTGKPKGVVLSHQAVVNTFEWVSRTFDVKPGDRLLFVTSPCFDLSVYDTFGALGAGATVVVASSHCMREPRSLVETIVSQQITIWDSAPAALQRLAPFFPKQGGLHLRLVMLSGDYIPLTLPDDVRRAFPAARVMSLGGATEAAIWSNWFPIGAIDPRWTSIPYGRPIQNAHYHVLDEQLRPVPIGVAGDLYIGGTCLAQGYLNRAELTAERFIRDPFRPKSRLYTTGDRARYYDDGVLEFLGRADFQVKIRGYRVELGEVEAAIAAIPGVREVLCTAYTDASEQKALVAYVVPQVDTTLDEVDVRRPLMAALPDFMVPAQIMLLDSMPVSSNGKVDRSALPCPSQRALPTEYVAPSTDLEQKLVAIWEDLLKRERIGITDSFFALGGQSLLAVLLVSRIERDLGVRIPLSRVLEQPTIEGLSRSLDQPAKPLRKGHLVTVSNGGSDTPIVFISGIGGFGFIFYGLGAHLGDTHPLHVLNAIGAEREDEAVEYTIEAVASVYEPQILAACPKDGPIVLGGYSFGVLVALELALRFERLGREVPLIVSFDGCAPGHPKQLPIEQRLLSHAREFTRRVNLGRQEYLQHRFENVKRRWAPVVEEAVLTPPDVLDPEMNARLIKVADGLFQARDHYRPKHRASSDVLLLKASVPLIWPGFYTDPLYGWRDFVRGRIDTRIVPGEHLKIFRTENDQLLAEILRERLREVGPHRVR